MPRIARPMASLVWIVAASASAQTGNPFAPPAGGGNPFAPGAAAPASPRLVMRLAQMNDPGTNNIASHTILVPEGWRLQGGAWWPSKPEMYGIPPSQMITVSAPDGRLVSVLPGMVAVDPHPSAMSMQYGNRRPADGESVNGLPVAALPDSAEAWRAAAERNIFRLIAPDAQDLRVDPVSTVPALNALLQRQLEPTRAMYAESNRQMAQLQTSVELDGNVFATTAHYTQGGKRFEHLLIFASCWRTTRSPMSSDVLWTVDPCVTYRAEEGQLAAQMPLLMAVANSLRMTQPWANMKADHLAKMSGIAAKGNADRGHIWADAAKDIGRTITEGYNDRSARTDRAADNYTKGFRGVEDYVPASGSNVPAVQLPHDYSNVYGNAQGEYVLSNDPNYDPNRDPAFANRTWEPMRPQP